MVVASADQMKTGMRKKLIPGARILKMVARKLMAPRIEDKPLK